MLIMIACDDIIEVEDISEETITILAPTNDSVLIQDAVLFTWNSIVEADNYRIQIATPSFENASQIVLDSSVVATNVSSILQIGDYEWRVRAENSEYQTSYTTQSFSIEE